MLKKSIAFLSILLILLPSIAFAQSIFESVVKNLEKIGFFEILLFLFFLGVLFAFFSKSKILGTNVVINGLISLIISFFLFVYPYLTGFSLIVPTTRFFTQITVIIIVFVFSFLVASIFYPDMVKMLTEQFKNPVVLVVMIVFGIGIFITSGMIQVFWKGFESPGPAMTGDLLTIVALLVIVIILLFVAGVIGGGGGKK